MSLLIDAYRKRIAWNFANAGLAALVALVLLGEPGRNAATPGDRVLTASRAQFGLRNCRTHRGRPGSQPPYPVAANCRFFPTMAMLLITGGRILPAPKYRNYAPWQAELRSTYIYTPQDIDADRKLPATDPHKYYLDRKADWERRHRCGGVYIGAGWVLTAAHCLTTEDSGQMPKLIDNFLTARRIRLGNPDLSRPGPDFVIEAAIVNKGYLDTKTRDDIALLKVNIGQPDARIGAAPVHILGERAGDQPLARGQKVFVTGWGATAPTFGGPMLLSTKGRPLRASARLKIVELTVMPNARCDSVDSLRGTISGAVICAGSLRAGNDACTWDSGGPLIRKSDLALVGLVSRGKGCGIKGQPSVYTRISLYRDWIRRARKAPTGRLTVL